MSRTKMGATTQAVRFNCVLLFRSLQQGLKPVDRHGKLGNGAVITTCEAVPQILVKPFHCFD